MRKAGRRGEWSCFRGRMSLGRLELRTEANKGRPPESGASMVTGAPGKGWLYRFCEDCHVERWATRKA